MASKAGRATAVRATTGDAQGPQPAAAVVGAHNATVSTRDLEDALKQSHARDEAERPARRLAAALQKEGRAVRDLDQARNETKQARAALKEG